MLPVGCRRRSTDIHALILNEREASRLTGRADVRSAAAHLASLGTTVVVTRGAAGAIAIEPDGQTVDVAAPAGRRRRSDRRR